MQILEHHHRRLFGGEADNPCLECFKSSKLELLSREIKRRVARLNWQRE